VRVYELTAHVCSDARLIPTNRGALDAVFEDRMIGAVGVLEVKCDVLGQPRWDVRWRAISKSDRLIHIRDTCRVNEVNILRRMLGVREHDCGEEERKDDGGARRRHDEGRAEIRVKWGEKGRAKRLGCEVKSRQCKGATYIHMRINQAFHDSGDSASDCGADDLRPPGYKVIGA
jgi:hypothetical protein